MQKVKFDISGMSCSACSAHIENKVNGMDGVSCSVNLLQNSMMAEFDEGRTDIESIINAVESVGYGAKVHDDRIEKEKKTPLQISLDQFSSRLAIMQSTIPKTVSSSAASTVHFRLPVSFFTVRRVVVQGQ